MRARAVKSLESLRLIEVHPGSGTVVLEPSPTPLFMADNFWSQGANRNVDYLLEFRKLIEVGVATLAAERADHRNIGHMQHALDRFRAEMKEGSGVTPDTDLSFHAALAAATKNPMVVTVWEMISERLVKMVAALSDSPYCTYALHEMEREHEKIFEAVKRGDAKAAAAGMQMHLNNAEVICQAAEAVQGSGNRHRTSQTAKATLKRPVRSRS